MNVDVERPILVGEARVTIHKKVVIEGAIGGHETGLKGKKIIYAGEEYTVEHHGPRVLKLRSTRDTTLVVSASVNSPCFEMNERTEETQ